QLSTQIPLNSTGVNTTEPGMVLGTPAYMSPEQVRGEPADHRADIFAFGAVLYEILNGAPAFRRDTPIASMNAVLSEEPPELDTTKANVPALLTRIVERCLAKMPDNRFQSARDLAFALASIHLTSETARSRSMDSSPVRTRYLRWGLATCLVLMLVI